MVDTFTAPVEFIKSLLPVTFEIIDMKFKKLIESYLEDVWEEDYSDWYLNGSVFIAIEKGEVSFWPIWPSKRYRDNVRPWVKDYVLNIGFEKLEKLFKYWDWNKKK